MLQNTYVKIPLKLLLLPIFLLAPAPWAFNIYSVYKLRTWGGRFVAHDTTIVLVITAQLNSKKSELMFCACSNHARGMPRLDIMSKM